MFFLVRESEPWGRSDSFEYLSFEDDTKKQVILNTKASISLASKGGYFPRGIMIGTGTHGGSKGQKSRLLFFLESLPILIWLSSPCASLTLPYSQSCLSLLGAVFHQIPRICQILQWCCDVHRERFCLYSCLYLRTRLRFISWLP